MSDQEEEGMQKMQAPPDFDGPTNERKCTDILCYLLLVAMWIGMTAIGIYAAQKGDYRLIVYPMDYTGNICGVNYKDVDMTDYPKLIYVNNLGGGVCVKKCPKIANLTDIHTFITYDGVWQGENATLSPNFVEIANYKNATNMKSCETEKACTTDPQYSWNSDGISEGYGFAFYAVNSFDTLGGTRCMADPLALKELKKQIRVRDDSIIKIDALDTGKKIMNNLYSDLYIARNYLMMTFGVALFVGLIYSVVLRIKFILSIIVWTSIFLTIAMFFGAGYFSIKKGSEWEDEVPQKMPSSSVTAIQATGIVLFVIGGCLVLITLFLRKQIRLATACVKEAARAIGSMPLIILLPIMESVAFFGFGAVWLFYAINLASIGELKTTTMPLKSSVTVRTFEYNTDVERSGWYLLFCFLWTSGLIGALGSIMVAMSVSKWYFSRDKSKVGTLTVLNSVTTTLYYHVGTAAFGSLIIGIIQLIRALIAKLQKKAKQMDSTIAQALLCCCQCCFYCFEKFMKFINKNAYIQTAIFGTSFCTSAREGFFLILRNALRVSSIGYVSTLVVFIGKFFISIITTGLVYMVMENDIGETVHSLFGPVIFVFIISYIVADVFMGLFDMSTSTILQCFIADEEMFSGEQSYADGKMRTFLDDFETSKKNILVSGP